MYVVASVCQLFCSQGVGVPLQGSNPSPLFAGPRPWPLTCSNLFKLDVTVQGYPLSGHVQLGPHHTGTPPHPTNTHTDMLILVHYEARTVNQRVIAIWLKCLLVLRSVNSHDVHLQQIWSLRSKISLSTTKVKILSKEPFVM